MSELTIAIVLEHYGADLTRVSDTGWRAIKCPFHGDRISSASVNLEKGAFCCHACEIRGDAIGVIRKVERLGFRDACHFAATILGASFNGICEATPSSRRKKPKSQFRVSLFD